MIQAIQSWSIRKLLTVYLSLALLVTVAFGASTFRLLIPFPVQVTAAHIPLSDDLDYEPGLVQQALMSFAETLAEVQLGETRPVEIQAQISGLHVAIDALTRDRSMSQSLATLPEYANTVRKLRTLLKKADELPVNPTREQMRQYRRQALAMASGMDELELDAHRMESRVKSGMTVELLGSHRLLALSVSLIWLSVGALGWLAVLRMRNQERKVSAYRDIAVARKRALDAATEAEMAQATFLGKLSHEINSPLQSILTNVQLLEARTSADDRRMEVVRRLQTGVRQLCGQVEDLLGMAEMKSGAVELNPEIISLNVCLDDTIGVLKTSAARKGIVLRVERPDLGAAYLDGRRLSQVITNLTTNAIRHTDIGGVVVSASVESAEGQKSLRVSVKDTGSGISPEAQQKLFQPFANTKNTRRGSGLGLAIVKGLVEQMNGAVDVSTTPSHGTEFIVTIPLEPSPERAGLAESVVGPTVPAQRRTVGPNTKLLFIEDDEAIQETLGDLLTEHGYQLDLVSTVNYGKAALLATKYDVVVLDLELPDGSGFEVAEYAAGTQNASTPLVAMTAYGELLKKRQARLFAERLVKPVGVATLTDALHHAMASAST